VPKVSVTIITENEAADIGAALDSVSWADERIVVDSCSTDGTVDIAGRRGARVVSREWPGYIAQKNYAASLARNDWILSVDADERVTPAG
jgi:glycosyltransferase involved in cell wall biosynthesis